MCSNVDADVLFAQFVKSRFERASEFAMVLQEVVADGFSDIRAGEDVVESACWKYQFRQVLGGKFLRGSSLVWRSRSCSVRRGVMIRGLGDGWFHWLMFAASRG